MSKKLNLKMDYDLAEMVFKIAKEKFEIRKIDSYAQSINEALIDWIKTNQKILKKPKNDSNNSKKTQEIPA